jgi:hypothetical protein
MVAPAHPNRPRLAREASQALMVLAASRELSRTVNHLDVHEHERARAWATTTDRLKLHAHQLQNCVINN